MKWQGRVRVQAEGGTVRNVSDPSGFSVRVEKADSVTIILAGATNYKNWNELGADPDARCESYLNAAGARSFAELKQRHLDDYQPLFRACAIDLGTNAAASQDTTTRLDQLRKGGTDPLFTAQYFQFGRYLLLAGSRPGTLAFNNHNMWLDDLQGRWRGRWTLNINLQECYWPAESANLAETSDALLTFIENLAASGSRTAKELIRLPRLVRAPRHGHLDEHRDDRRHHLGHDAADGRLDGAIAVGALSLRPRSEISGEEFIRCSKARRNSVLDYLVEEPKHHWLVTCPSASPENSFLLPDGTPKRALRRAGPRFRTVARCLQRMHRSFDEAGRG